MSRLARKLAEAKVEKNTLAIYWLAQAGFAFKTPSGLTVYVDPYFSEVVERKFGFKRLVPCPITDEEVEADLLVCTHEHLDHMDTDALPTIARKGYTHFAGPIECYKHFLAIGIPARRCHLLEEGKTLEVSGTRVHAVFADHGKLAVDALGVVIDFDGIKVYHTGDTAYRPDEFAPAIAMQPDILLPCINGVYGNMDAQEAARLTRSIEPRLVIPTHFGMFAEHKGDVGLFMEQCAALAPAAKTVLLEPGEEYIFAKA